MHFRKKNGFHSIFVTSSHIEKLSRNVQLTIFRERTHVASELFFFYVELWAKNTNPQHRHTPFPISKKFSETLYKTKNPRQVFRNLRAGPILAVLSLLLQKLLWRSSFRDIYWDIYRPQRTKIMPPG